MHLPIYSLLVMYSTWAQLEFQLNYMMQIICQIKTCIVRLLHKKCKFLLISINKYIISNIMVYIAYKEWNKN